MLLAHWMETRNLHINGISMTCPLGETYREGRGKGVLSQAGILLVDGGHVLEGNGSRNPRYSLVIFSVISYFTTFVLFDGLLSYILYTVALIGDWMIVDSSKESPR